jgi:hypothetical protein
VRCRSEILKLVSKSFLGCCGSLCAMVHTERQPTKSSSGKAPQKQLAINATHESVHSTRGAKKPYCYRSGTVHAMKLHTIRISDSQTPLLASGTRNCSKLQNWSTIPECFAAGQWVLAGWPIVRHQSVCCPCYTCNNYTKDIQPAYYIQGEDA